MAALTIFTLQCLPSPRAVLPVRAFRLPARLERVETRRSRTRLCAVQDEEKGEIDGTVPGPVASPPVEQKPAAVDRKAQRRAETEKGQTTAIVTGAIAVALGVAYLVLIQLLDTRGVTLLPPPPEAFEP